MSPYRTVFRKPCHLPLELEYKEKRLLQLNELEELRNEAYDNARIYKDKTKKWHDQRILRREFKVGELVLLYNSRLRLFPRKLKSRWSSPYTIILVTTFGAVTLRAYSRNEFKVNGLRLKHYHGGILNEEQTWIRSIEEIAENRAYYNNVQLRTLN